jgi:hypothetical protein
MAHGQVFLDNEGRVFTIWIWRSKPEMRSFQGFELRLFVFPLRYPRNIMLWADSRHPWFLFPQCYPYQCKTHWGFISSYKTWGFAQGI